jgi:thiamine-monophosphate kinase
MKVGDLGEFGLIELLDRIVSQGTRSHVPTAHGFELLLSIGDDAAAWRSPQGVELATTDTMVEGVHFTQDTIPWGDVGWKAIVTNLSDIAAMGGAPLYALVTIGINYRTEVEDVEQLYLGMIEACNEFQLRIIGGDIVYSPTTFITVCLTGHHISAPMTRSAAALGDLIAVTGYIGSSSAGLDLLLGEHSTNDKEIGYLIDCHRRPFPRLHAGQLLSKSGVKAAIDVSDGLVGDLSRFCSSSMVAARLHVDKIPVHPYLKRLLPDKWLQMALFGGEDYELIFSGSAKLQKTISKDSELAGQAIIIGEMCEGDPGKVFILDSDGSELNVRGSGWDHLREKW